MRNKLIIVAVCALALAFFGAPAFAQEAQPGDPCTVADQFLHTGGPENPGVGHFIVCDGSVWKPVMRHFPDGKVLFNSSGVAAAPLHVWGEAIIGEQGLACSASTEGAIRYNSAGQLIDYCDGTAWTALGGGANAIDDLTDAAKNLVDSNQFIGHDGGAVGASDDNNTGIGIDALDALNGTGGDGNTALGTAALSSNSNGDQNTAVGYRAGFTTTNGNDNSFFGSFAGNLNTLGSDNSFFGRFGGYNNTTGNENVFIDYGAGCNNVAKSNSTAIGKDAMYYADNTATASAANNTGVGYQALRGSTTAANNTGTNNVAVGAFALDANTTGFENTALGMNALTNNTTGQRVTAIGKQALEANTTGIYNVALGYGAGDDLSPEISLI